jgi:hypothetical protein
MMNAIAIVRNEKVVEWESAYVANSVDAVETVAVERISVDRLEWEREIGRGEWTRRTDEETAAVKFKPAGAP